jgi:predicted DNA-binding antitoxin AbrB/MazE fold protein
MHHLIEVVYENGVLRPLEPLPSEFREHQRLTVILEGSNATRNWLADADPTINLEAVRQALAKIPGTLAQAVDAERAER